LSKIDSSKNSNKSSTVTKTNTLRFNFEFINVFIDAFINASRSTSETVHPPSEVSKPWHSKDLMHSPSLSLLSQIADVFGVNKSWLQKGTGFPFKFDVTKVYHPGECLDYFSKLSPLKYYFVLSDNKDMAIILQLSEYKFNTISRSWTLDANLVGRTGQRQMESLCYLLEKLNITSTCGRIVSQKLFDALNSGEICPGIIALQQYRNDKMSYEIKSSYWQEDIIDIRHRHRTANEYKAMYGDWFLEAQKIFSFVRENNLAYGMKYSNGVLIPDENS
jgi:hypothetical protein